VLGERRSLEGLDALRLWVIRQDHDHFFLG
jgi:hypothetical protein